MDLDRNTSQNHGFVSVNHDNVSQKVMRRAVRLAVINWIATRCPSRNLQNAMKTAVIRGSDNDSLLIPPLFVAGTQFAVCYIEDGRKCL